MPYYLTEADHAADTAARSKVMTTQKGDTWRSREARETQWRAERKIESEDPGEGDTFLPRG